MIQLLEAPPRSGKTYFAVNYICKYTTYDDVYHEFSLQPDVLVISNIEGLRVNHWDLKECLKNRKLEEFFSIENFEAIMAKTGKNHIILAIDECHDFFPAGYKNDKVYSFFAYHGHIGLDIILMCQDLTMTSRMFNPLLEYIVQVTPRSRAVLNRFSYSYVSVKGHFLYSKTLEKKPLVFKAYKSFRKDEKVKPKNAIKHWVLITVVIFACSGLLFKTALGIVKGKSEASAKRTRAAQAANQKPAAQVAAPSPPAGAVAFNNLSSQKPVAFHNVTSAGRSPVVLGGALAAAVPGGGGDPGQIIGVIREGKANRYLLKDGRVLRSAKAYSVGDVI